MDRWTDRLIGAAVAIALCLLIVFLDGYGVWQRLWEWSGLWRYLPSEVVTFQAVEPILTNAGFETGFYQYNKIGELTVANNWVPWYQENKNSPGGAQYHRPEFKPEQVGVGKGRVHSGVYAQKMFTTYSPHDGGLWQRIQATPGQWYKFSAWVYVWSSGEDNADVSKNPGRYRAMVGANPWGDWAGADTTIWGQEVVDVYDKWVQVSVTFQAWGPTISVFTRGNQWYGAKHGDSYWDNLAFDKVDFGQVCPTPIPCPSNGIDYDRINQMIIDRLPVRWPR